MNELQSVGIVRTVKIDNIIDNEKMLTKKTKTQKKIK